MKKLIIDGKLYAISPHKTGRNYDLMKWIVYGDKGKAKHGVDGRFTFDSCHNDFECLAKHVLNRQISDEIAHSMQELLIAWKDAVKAIKDSLERI